MLRRRSKLVSSTALAGGAGGGAIAWLAWLLLDPRGMPLRLVTILGASAAGYAAGVIAAHRRQETIDVDYILRLREELRRSQDHIMETATFQSLGAYLEIAAHQIKEPLQALGSGVQSLVAEPALAEPARRSVAALRERMSALQETLRHLASYSLSKPGRAPFSVNHLLRDALQLCRHRAEEKKIVFEERYAVIPPVFGPAGRVHQAILSIVINALEAMPFGGGTIVVETAHESDRVVARVRDVGIGIRPEHLPRIFDPFFTTKPERSGVGLGLWAARQTCDLIGADVRVTSAPLQGTEVTVLFPQAAPLRPGREGTTNPPELPKNMAEEGDRRIA